jgi:hypothetical protein
MQAQPARAEGPHGTDEGETGRLSVIDRSTAVDWGGGLALASVAREVSAI